MVNLRRGIVSLIPPKKSKLAYFDPEMFDRPKRKGASGKIFNIEIGKIKANPYQPRTQFDKEALEKLSESIKEYGILQPLVVSRRIRYTPLGQRVKYELITGERRLRAARLAGYNQVPVIIKESTPQEKLELALVENIQRADLNSIEEAQAYKQLAEDFGLSHQQISGKVGKSREAVTNAIRLLNLPKTIQNYISQGKLTAAHARSILSLKDTAAERDFANLIIKSGMSAKEAERKSRELQGRSHRRHVAQDPELENLARELAESLKTRVLIRNAIRGGNINIRFADRKDLDRLSLRIMR